MKAAATRPFSLSVRSSREETGRFEDGAASARRLWGVIQIAGRLPKDPSRRALKSIWRSGSMGCRAVKWPAGAMGTPAVKPVRQNVAHAER